MSWLNANDYMVMDVVARERAEELRETRELTSAYARGDDEPGHRASARAGCARPAGPCWILRGTTAAPSRVY